MRRLTSTVLIARAACVGTAYFGSGRPHEDASDAELLKKRPFEGGNLQEGNAKTDKRSSPNSSNPLNTLLSFFRGEASAKIDHQANPPRANNRLSTIIAREQYEESIKEELPPKPRPPRGWMLDHKVGTNFFSLSKNVHIEGSSGPEKLTAIAKMETKIPDVTYQANTGERTEQQHLVFSLFVQRVYDPIEADSAPSRTRPRHRGGLEFTLTSVDSELVLDGLAVHSAEEELEAAMRLGFQSKEINNIVSISSQSEGKRPSPFAFKTFSKQPRESPLNKNIKYRGPYTNELDEELTDEIFDYLDDRGINNAFAEFMMSQAHYLEQEEYQNWLELLKQFSRAPAPTNKTQGL